MKKHFLLPIALSLVALTACGEKDTSSNTKPPKTREIVYNLNYSGAAEGESYHSSTTFFGFRYCEVTPSDDVEILGIEAQPVSSSTEDRGSVETSNALVNQLFSNITWGQRGNLLRRQRNQDRR